MPRLAALLRIAYYEATGGARPAAKMSAMLVKSYSDDLKMRSVACKATVYVTLSASSIAAWCMLSHSSHFSFTMVWLELSHLCNAEACTFFTWLCWWAYTIYWPVAKHSSNAQAQIIRYVLFFNMGEYIVGNIKQS